MKILIIGSVASGKSTYSKKLSKKLGIKRYEIDSIVHDDFKNIKRTEKEQKRIIDKNNKNNEWIMEGVLRKNLYYLLDYADKIILIDTNYYVRKYRIIKRYISQKLNIEKSNYKPSINMVRNMFKWNKQFEMNKKQLLNKLKKYEDKLEILRK